MSQSYIMRVIKTSIVVNLQHMCNSRVVVVVNAAKEGFLSGCRT
jgi:hypothetical protein